MYLSMFAMTLLFSECQSNWKIEWRDEFDNRSLDDTKWTAVDKCDGNHIHQLHCDTRNERNLQLIDGVLAMTAVREHYNGKEYTAAYIQAKHPLLFGRIEMRIALPKAKSVRTAILLVPNQVINGWPDDGQINIMVNEQGNLIKSGIHYRNNGYLGNEYKAGDNLNEFHSYVVEWNSSKLVWKFDGKQYYQVMLSDIFTTDYKPFEKKFKLLMSVGVGGMLNGQKIFAEELTLHDVYRWPCSAMIVDYVRYYHYTNQSVDTQQDRGSPSAHEVCSKVMNRTRVQFNDTMIGNTTVTPRVKMGLTTSELAMLISMASVIMLILFVPITIWFVVKKLRAIESRNMEGDATFYYDDIDHNKTNDYEQPGQYTYILPHEGPTLPDPRYMEMKSK